MKRSIAGLFLFLSQDNKSIAIFLGNKYERGAELQQQTNQGMALDESSTTTKSYLLGFYPQDKLFQTKQGKETDLCSVENA